MSPRIPNPVAWILGGAMLLLLGTSAFGASAAVKRHGDAPAPAPASAPTADAAALYETECGACHLAYPPGLLPAASWRKVLGGLDSHFGENAELGGTERARIEAWLVGNAAESGSNRKSSKILRSLGGAAPLRITEVPYIRRKHHELKASVFERPSVGSRSNCNACHSGAAEGNFHRHRVPRS